MSKKSINTKRIEMLSINYLKNSFLESERIDPQINDNDKEPSWDGYIYLYENEEFKKDNLIRIPIQVKGKYIKDDFSGNTYKYDVEKRDLINFRSDNGVLFLIVQIKDKNVCKVYYNDLLSSDINLLLDKMGEQKQKRVEFKHYDMSNSHKIETVLLNFHINRLNHSPKTVYVQDPSKFDEFKVEIKAYEDTIKETIFEQQRLYGTIRTLPDSLIPIGKVHLEKVSNVKRKISVNNVEYYKNFTTKETKDKIQSNIGKSFKITVNKPILEKNNIEFNIKMNGFFYERYKDSKFIKALMKEGSLEINDEKLDIPIDLEIDNKMLEYFDFLENISLLYDLLNINEDLDMNSMTKNDFNKLVYLIEYYIKGNKEIYDFENNGKYEVNISNIYLKFYAIKLDDNNYELVNLFDNKFYSEAAFIYEKGVTERHSFLLTLAKDDLINLSNVNTEFLYNSIIEKENNYSKNFFLSLRLFLLEVIHAYDETKSDDLYELSLKISKFLIKKNDEPVLEVINRYQIIKRKRVLNKNEISEIINYKKNYLIKEKNEAILFALNVLIDNMNEAAINFENTSEEWKSLIKTYPIYTLYIRNKEQL